MKFENTHVSNFEGAFRGLRNPKNSWKKSDSYFNIIPTAWREADINIDLIVEKWMKEQNPDVDLAKMEYTEYCSKNDEVYQWLLKNMILDTSQNGDYRQVAALGPNDLKLAQTLISAGSEHCKFMRQIFVSVDITAPFYWWKEADQYKVGTTTDSTSTMHKLTSKPITLECFEVNDYEPILCRFNAVGGNTTISQDGQDDKNFNSELDILVNAFEQFVIPYCEFLRQKYLETKDMKIWKELIRVLPESYLQKRTWTGSYANIRNMVQQRQSHKLIEWSQDFIGWAHSLPYSDELIFINKKAN